LSQKPRDIEYLRTIIVAGFEKVDEEKEFVSPLFIPWPNFVTGV
jgi:hypothetical protein